MFEGFRVVELGTWVMMPSAATVLAEFGADVIKVEHPRGGDPFRASSLARQGDVNLAVEQVNRGKRSVGLDLSVAEGRELLYKLVASSDVFMTNFLPGARQKYRFDVEHIRAHNPDIVYVRGSSVGVRGAEADRPGFDFTVFWARSGFQSAVTKGSGLDRPVSPRPGFGDKTSAMNIAFGVAAALLRRERTGETAVVDVSLLGSGLWSGSSDVVYSRGLGRDFAARPLPRQPTSGVYRTSDGRFILFNIPDAGRVWPDLCRHVGREDLVDDARFATAQARSEHADACVRELETAFAGAPLSEWRRR
ncbi:MAG TPA: CoA transferase, partial [Acidimicrobiales bacterium]|nr:CoA transferase [Acidimicrobiales bacterium]